MTKKNAFKSLLYIFITLFSIALSAATCNEESPNHKTEGDKYFDLNETPSLTRAQKNAIKSFIKPFTGKRLQGSATITVCVGPERIAKEKTTHEKLKAKISTLSDGQLLIKLDVYNQDKKSTYNETLKYFGKQTSQEIKKLNENEISIVSKYRKRRPGNSGSNAIFTEEIINLKSKKNTLTITVIRYTSGYFAIQHERKLYF